MKTKHIFISVILATFFFASTSTTQAQSKEETIEWIKRKLERNFNNNSFKYVRVKATVEPCMIILETYFNDTDFYRWYIPTGSETYIEKYSDGFHIRGGFKVEEHFPNSKTKFFVNKSWSYYKILTKEENLGERMEKAIRHLNTFCKETF